MSVDHPEFLWLLVLVPIDIALALWRRRGIPASLAAIGSVAGRTRRLAFHRGLSLLSMVASTLFIASASLALSGPSWGRRFERIERSGLELALVLDVSRSMEAGDAGGTRLEAARTLARLLLDQRSGDSFSLTLAKGEGLLLVPMTEDLDAVEAALDYASPAAMSQAGTDLGRGIKTALDSFSPVANPARVLVVLSDGGDLGRSARSAAVDARAKDVRILTIGFGGPEPVPVPGADGRPLAGPTGAPVKSALEAGLLRSLASITGGRYFEAGDSGSLPALEAELDSAGGGGTRSVARVRDEAVLFSFLALVALIARVLAGLLAPGTWDPRVPFIKMPGRNRKASPIAPGIFTRELAP